VGFKE